MLWLIIQILATIWFTCGLWACWKGTRGVKYYQMVQSLYESTQGGAEDNLVRNWLYLGGALQRVLVCVVLLTFGWGAAIAIVEMYEEGVYER